MLWLKVLISNTKEYRSTKGLNSKIVLIKFSRLLAEVGGLLYRVVSFSKFLQLYLTTAEQNQNFFMVVHFACASSSENLLVKTFYEKMFFQNWIFWLQIWPSFIYLAWIRFRNNFRLKHFFIKLQHNLQEKALLILLIRIRWKGDVLLELLQPKRCLIWKQEHN